jgi:hypothetical protein
VIAIDTWYSGIMKPRDILTEKFVREAVGRGKRSRDIAKETGLNDRTIRYYFKKYDLTVPKWKPHKVWNKGIKAIDDERVAYAVEKANKARRGKKAWNNKGGFVNEHGYRMIYVGGKRKREHVYIIEKSIGRRIKPDECVHHVNHDKLDNNLSNLRLMTKSNHAKLHQPKGSRFGKNKALATW